MTNKGKDEPRYKGDAILLDTRVETLEHETAEAKKRDEQYKQEQVTTNRRIALFSGLLVACTLATAGVGIYQAIISKKAADAAKSAADTAHDALIVGQRPWIKIKHRVVKPLNFGFVGAAGPAATMTVEDTIENVGNGVALNVVSWEDIIPLDPNMATTSARARQDQWCNANKRFDPKSPTQLNGYSLFPKDPFIQNSGMGPLMSTVKKAVENNMANMKFLHKGNGPNPLIGKVALAMDWMYCLSFSA